MHPRTLLASLSMCAALGAQVTSPRGLNAAEGNALFGHFGGGSRRFQQVDATQVGQPMLIRSIAWRRNASTSQTAPARTLDLTIDLGHSDFGVLSEFLDDNFRVSRTNAFNRTGVSFPDWSASLRGPTPFDFQVPLATPFAYNGSDALVIDFTYTNASAATLVQCDREFNGSTLVGGGAALGVGCTASGQTARFAHVMGLADQGNVPTPAYGLRMQVGGSNAPANSAVFTFIDHHDQNLAGVLCGTVHALPLVLLTLVSRADGSVPVVNFMFPYQASLIGGTFVTQLVAVDYGYAIPLVVSNGRQMTLTANPFQSPHRCSYAYAGPSTVSVAPHYVGGGMVMLLQ